MSLSRLIVNADDLGISTAVNRAILTSMESGLVTSASMMANMPGFEDAVTLVREHGLLKDKIGVHLNFTEGRPLSRPILDCPLFCNNRGNFIFNRQRHLWRLHRREKAAVYEEMKAQLQRVLAAGIQPTHLDSHHHFHTEWAIAPLVCRLGREYGIPRIRLTRNIGNIPGFYKRLYKTLFNRWRIGGSQDFHNTDYFGDIADMKTFIPHGQLEGRSVEIMVHPLFNTLGEIVDLDGSNLYAQLETVLSTLSISPTDQH